MLTSWRRAGALRVADVPAPVVRFDSSQAIVIASSDEFLAMNPPFLQTLCTELEVDALSGRLCPVLLGDHSVAILSLAEHVGSDQADELARRVRQHGYALAVPQRYVLAAPLLLAISRKQITAQTPLVRQGESLQTSRTALAEAFQDMVEWGVRHGASDLHLNVRLRETESEVRYTLAGRYVAPERFRRIPTTTLVDMLAVAWMDISGGNGAVFDPLLEQQGRLTRYVDGQKIMLRWASLAADQGPSVCLRILERDAVALCSSLDQLGYLPGQIQVIERAMLSEGGAIVFAGTVGSGKSTTLASLMATIPEDRKVVTLEDPVEYLIPRAIQNTVVRDLSSTDHDGFSAKLRTLKRSAMNDVLIGEIRDRETGRVFMDLAGSGVNVYTTTHAPSAALISERLASDFIGVSRDFLATIGVLKLLVYQVLLPKLCAQCALPSTDLLKKTDGSGSSGRSAAQWRQWLERLQRLYGCDVDLLKIRNPLGCPACRNTQIPRLHGYVGRTVAAEYIEPALTAGFLDGIKHRRCTVDTGRSTRLDTSLAQGGRHGTAHWTAMQCAVYKAFLGQIDPRDIEPHFQPFETLERLQHPVSRQRLQVAQ